MKKILFFALAVIALAACDKGKEPEGGQKIKIIDGLTDQTVFADQTEGKSAVTFTTTGAWSSMVTPGNFVPCPTCLSAPVDWVSISPDHGDAAGSYTVSITLTPNYSGEKRTATITSGGESVKIAVTQEAVREDGTNPASDGVLINGVRWATRNVDKPGSFAANPEDYGMFYQWNRKVGWSSTDPMVNSNGGTEWNPTIPEGTAWSTANDPCPTGWRVPTLEEIDKLLAADKVSNELTTVTGITGCKFTDNATGASLFLPAAGARDYTNGALALDNTSAMGIYWSSVQYDDHNAFCLGFFIITRSYNYYACRDGNGRRFGIPVRCVAE